MCNLAKALRHSTPIVRRREQLSYLGEAEPRALSSAYNGKRSQDVRRIATPTGRPFWLWKHTYRLVIADGRGAQSRAAGDFPNQQFGFSHLTSSRL